MRAMTMTLTLALATAALVARADGKHGTAVAAEALQWNEMSAKAPGVEIAALQGDWKAGPYQAFIKFPPGSRSGLHTHSSEMKIVVVSGSFRYGATDAEAQAYGPGSYIVIAADAPHTNQQPEGCTLFVEQPGKFDTKAAR